MSNEKENNASFVCKSCGAKLNVDPSQVMAICDYCGSSMLVSELINESDDVKIQKIKSQAYKDVEMGKQQLEAERIKSEAEKEKRQADENSVEKFKKSKFSKVLIIFAVVSALFCAVAFNDGKILAGFIGIIQTALFVVAYLMGIQVIKEKKRNLRTLVAIIAFVLFIPFLSLYNTDTDETINFEWSDIVLCEVIPQPESTLGEIHYNSESELWVSIHKISEKQYQDYISACKQKGFTIDIEQYSSSYEAYNSDGYKLNLSYYESDNELWIMLDESTPDDTSEETQKQEEIVYADDEVIQAFIAKYNELYPASKITSDMITKDYHHGSYHDDQVNLDIDNVRVTLSSTYINGGNDGVKVFIDYEFNPPESAVKNIYKKVMKVFNSSISESNLEKYWSEITDTTYSNLDEYEDIELHYSKGGFFSITGEVQTK